MSSYFSIPSFARAKQNKEQLEKTNPQNPVLNEEDEKFLEKQVSHSEAPKEAENAPATKIADDGTETEVPKEEAEQAGASADQQVVPEEKPQQQPASKPADGDETQESKREPESGDGTSDSKPEEAPKEEAEDPPEQAPEETKTEKPALERKKSKKKTGLDLPSQEEAEAATRSFNLGADEGSKAGGAQGEDGKGEKRTWASYIPSIGTGAKKDKQPEQKPGSEQEDSEKPTEEQRDTLKDGEPVQGAEKRTWTEYASSAYSSLPAMPSIPTWKSKDKDSKAEPVYNEDGTVNEEKTKEKQEKEVSVLLDNLNMSSINNRVFAFSGETQNIYARFAEVLKDTINGGPTAYQDMEKLMQEAGPQLEKQFASMPPFVQTLVKSLPAKLGTSLGPELLAAASEKPGNDMKSNMEAANKRATSGGPPELQTSSSSTTAEKGGEDAQKKKKKIPGLKGLVSGQGAVASILRNVVTFLQTRFPFLASATNVAMSLAVFILMFVFWYCHKRGKEARLAREAAKGGESKVLEEDEDGELEVEVSDEEEGEDEKPSAEETEENEKGGAEEGEAEKEDAPSKPETSEVPLPDTEKREKGAELEATKSVGT